MEKTIGQEGILQDWTYWWRRTKEKNSYLDELLGFKCAHLGLKEKKKIHINVEA